MRSMPVPSVPRSATKSTNIYAGLGLPNWMHGTDTSVPTWLEPALAGIGTSLLGRVTSAARTFIDGLGEGAYEAGVEMEEGEFLFPLVP